MGKIKWILYGVIGVFILWRLFSGGSDSSTDTVTEEVVVPTQGLITTLQQQPDSLFLIEDEQTVDNPAESLVIAKYLDGQIDTFTLDEVKLMATSDNNNGSGHGRSMYRAVSYGLMGYWLVRSMSSRPRAGAYVDQKTYSRVSNNAGQSLNRTASRTSVSRPRSGSSGYGGSRSTRSYGG